MIRVPPLLRNSASNLLGQAVPLTVAIVAIPLLVDGLGTARFGVLTLAWMVVGYFSLFDFGLGRALTQALSERLATGRTEGIATLTWTALALMGLLGIVGAIVCAAGAPRAVQSLVNVPQELERETLHTFYLLAVSLPFVISTAALRGVLEAEQRFVVINAVRIPLGVFSFVGPLLVLPFSDSLVAVTAVLVGGRVVAWVVHLGLCLWTSPQLRRVPQLDRRTMGPLLRFGSWAMVSNIISPLMVYLDRFLVGALLSVSFVSYYVTPQEMVTKLGILPGAFAAALFPALVGSYARERHRTAALFDRGLRVTLLSMFPPVLAVAAFSHEGLQLWLGVEFARHGTRALQWLAVGVLINGVAQIPFAMVQGAGRPDLTAKLHLAEMPVYLLVAYWLTQHYGVEGTALAWTGRAAVDTTALLLLTGRILPEGRRLAGRALLWLAVAIIPCIVAVSLEPFSVRALWVAVVLVGFAVVAWSGMLSEEERAWTRGLWAAHRAGRASVP